MQSEAGSTMAGLQKQEDGHKRSKPQNELLVPTAHAAGQGRANKRTRVVQTRYKHANIKPLLAVPTAKKQNPKQNLIIAIRMAIKNNMQFIDLAEGMGVKKPGIYEITNPNNTAPLRGWPDGTGLESVYDKSSAETTIPAREWLKPAGEKAVPKAQKMFMRHLEKQLQYRLKKRR